jgi:hypothetical protein
MRGVVLPVLDALRGKVLVPNDEKTLRVLFFRRLGDVEGPGGPNPSLSVPLFHEAAE